MLKAGCKSAKKIALITELSFLYTFYKILHIRSERQIIVGVGVHDDPFYSTQSDTPYLSFKFKKQASTELNYSVGQEAEFR